MSQKFLNRVKFATGTTGQGTIAVGAASSAAFLTPAGAGGVEGDVVDYLIEEGADFEIGRGTLTNYATEMSRDEVYLSVIGGVVGTSKIDLNGNGLVRFIHAGENMVGRKGKNVWEDQQIMEPHDLTHNTAWDSKYANLQVEVDGSNFGVANPTTVPDAGAYVAVTVVYATTHSISFGDKFLGIASVTPSDTEGMEDHWVFRSDGTNLKCVSFRADIAASE